MGDPNRKASQLVGSNTQQRGQPDPSADARAELSTLSALSHEMRNPLNIIAGYAQLLQDDESLSPNARKRVDKIAKAGDHLLHLIDGILRVARSESESTPADLRMVELRPFVRDAVSFFEGQAKEKGLSLSVHLAENVPQSAMIDRLKVRKILINLVGNAVKFTREGGVVVLVSVVDPTADGCLLKLQVSDTGPGIPAHEREVVFEPFSRGAAGSESNGTGLGLAICKQDAERLGGSLELESKPGKGTVVRFRLPVTWSQYASGTFPTSDDERSKQAPYDS